jgi:predicted nucleotidyltransferase
MLKLLISSESRRKVMEFFILHSAGRFYVRETQRLTGVALGALQRELGSLEKAGFLNVAWTGPLKYFALNADHPDLPELKGLFLKERRRKLLEKNLRRVLKILKEKYRPDRVILYGSLATGRIHPSSDLDLVIVKKNLPKRYWDRVKEVSALLADRDVAIDFTIWTPDELQDDRENPFLKEEVMKKGKTVYERAA